MKNLSDAVCFLRLRVCLDSTEEKGTFDDGSPVDV